MTGYDPHWTLSTGKFVASISERALNEEISGWFTHRRMGTVVTK